MALHPQQLTFMLDKIAERIELADASFDRSLQGDPYGEGNADWYLQLAFTQLLTVAEAQGLPLLRGEIMRDLEAARADGLLKGDSDPDGNISLKWATPARRYHRALQSAYAAESARTVTKDLESILRAATYSICDPQLFGAPPKDEASVHARLEGILRCVFPDLLHKPRLVKPIKHFEPDTGIPSIQTLVEYKFLSSPQRVGAVAEEVLADTRGYTFKDWTSFVYVIYEMARIRAENQWSQLLRECGLDARTSVVVLSGEPKRRGKRRLPNEMHQTAGPADGSAPGRR